MGGSWDTDVVMAETHHCYLSNMMLQDLNPKWLLEISSRSQVLINRLKLLFVVNVVKNNHQE
jgi:hypothetical protein